MPQICKYQGCKWPVWGGGYCKIHQYLRNKPTMNSIRKVSSKKQKEIITTSREDNEFYTKIWNSRAHVCAYCQRSLLGEPHKHNFDHVLDKSKFDSLRHEEDNIALTCWPCHQQKTAKRYTDKMKAIILNVAFVFIQRGKLTQVGPPDAYRLKDYIIENSNT